MPKISNQFFSDISRKSGSEFTIENKQSHLIVIIMLPTNFYEDWAIRIEVMGFERFSLPFTS